MSSDYKATLRLYDETGELIKTEEVACVLIGDMSKFELRLPESFVVKANQTIRVEWPVVVLTGLNVSMGA